MSTRRAKIVLYYPQEWPRGLAGKGGAPFTRYSQTLPTSLLQIAAWPVHDGYEVVIIDGTRYPVEEAHRRVVEACDGALLYATTGILGPQVADSLHCSQKVRARYPNLPSFIGGWFASVMPELELESGVYDAVVLGQGELTFRELVAAVESGSPLDDIAGLAFMRDGEMVKTEMRRVVGWTELLDSPWHLLDAEDYRRPQRAEIERNGDVRNFGRGRPRFEITHFSSFGCPMGCSFCCSPDFTGQRWTAMSAERMLDDLQGLQERWGFDGVNFQDPNFAVSQKRMVEFAEGLLERNMRMDWFVLLQTDAILRMPDSALETLAAAGLYACLLGAEAGDEATRKAIHKPIVEDGSVRAAERLYKHGIRPYLTYIIGHPKESTESMWSTLAEAQRAIVAAPEAMIDIYSHRPLPGTEDWQIALDGGHVPPKTLDEWGTISDYWDEEPWPGRIPRDVWRARSLFMHYARLAIGRVRGRNGFWENRAMQHLRRGTWRTASLEAKAFHVIDRRRSRRSMKLAGTPG